MQVRRCSRYSYNVLTQPQREGLSKLIGNVGDVLENLFGSGQVVAVQVTSASIQPCEDQKSLANAALAEDAQATSNVLSSTLTYSY